MKRKRKALDLSGEKLVRLKVVADLPSCFGTYEIGLCTGEFCSDVFSACKEKTDAGSPAAEKIPVRDDEEV